MEFIFNPIYNLPNLKSLKFDFNCHSESNYWSRGVPFNIAQIFPIQLSMAALVCPKIKSIEIRRHSSLSVCSQVYESMKDFNHFQRLNLYFSIHNFRHWVQLFDRNTQRLYTINTFIARHSPYLWRFPAKYWKIFSQNSIFKSGESVRYIHIMWQW